MGVGGRVNIQNRQTAGKKSLAQGEKGSHHLSCLPDTENYFKQILFSDRMDVTQVLKFVGDWRRLQLLDIDYKI